MFLMAYHHENGWSRQGGAGRLALQGNELTGRPLRVCVRTPKISTQPWKPPLLTGGARPSGLAKERRLSKAMGPLGPEARHAPRQPYCVQTASELSFRALLFARGICSAAASVPGEEVTDQKGEAGHFRPSLAGSNVASFCHSDERRIARGGIPTLSKNEIGTSSS